MRRSTSLSVACAAAVALVLAGCTGSGEETSLGPDQPAAAIADHDADVDALARVSLTGNLGTMPFFNFKPPLTLTGEVAREADEGTGPAVEPGDAVAVHVASLNANTETIEASSYEEGRGPELLLVDEANLPPALYEAVIGSRVGSRVLFGAPVDTVTMIYSFEILAAAPVFERAEGEAVTQPRGLPVVTSSDGGEPKLAPVTGDPPADLVVQPLVTGSGDPVGAESWVVVNHASWLWDGTELASTWNEGGPTVVRLTDAISGWQEGLAGQPIGSRVMLLVPPAKAFGDDASEMIPAGSTLVYVVDILAGM
ncbi:FKBP-type peptidyl-prolyl cis-trans isomerase [Streptosporangium sp. NPDC087985]|uniref:FKBP-type peptidyl-prolyl cis-trans isomerase n=1 Tax=Streptosporangium sp. NPDC087985 TaxID=3366196 RepID=UPI00380836AE